MCPYVYIALISGYIVHYIYIAEENLGSRSVVLKNLFVSFCWFFMFDDEDEENPEVCRFFFSVTPHPPLFLELLNHIIQENKKLDWFAIHTIYLIDMLFTLIVMLNSSVRSANSTISLIAPNIEFMLEYNPEC